MYIDEKIARKPSTISNEEWEAILNLAQEMVEAKVDVQEKKNNLQNEIKTEEKIRLRIKQLFKKIGLPPHLLGYKYLEEAIYMCYTDDQYRYCITKWVYPNIAQKFGTTPSRVERAIRHSIEWVCSNADLEIWQQIFTGISFKKGKPTNGHAIAALVEYLKMEEM